MSNIPDNPVRSPDLETRAYDGGRGAISLPEGWPEQNRRRRLDSPLFS